MLHFVITHGRCASFMDAAASPFTRDRSGEFFFIRSAVHGSGWAQRVPVASEMVTATPMGDGIDPPWCRAVESFNGLQRTVMERMKLLFDRQLQFLNPNILSDEEEASRRTSIDRDAHEVRKLLCELERLVAGCGKQRNFASEDEQCVSESVKKYLATRFVHLSKTFKEGQVLFSGKLKQREEKTKRYKLVGPPEAHRRMEEEDKVSQYLDEGYTPADIQELLIEDERAEEMKQTISEIVLGVEELNAVVQNLASMVVEQGTILDRIDVNINKVQTGVGNSVTKLKEVKEYRGTCVSM
uniref:Putative syntaxin n=1 Tax=Trypanosoma congolense (strain IL3000) TaxID=1068625 RepID=G0UXX2_TRYCI|nr:putative syntaxin [Trypanosoma congolense IL3000]